MKKIIFSALFLLPMTGFATEFYNPKVTVDGVTYGLVDSDEAGTFYDSPTGFCRLQGFTGYSSASAEITNNGPLAILNSDGAVVSTFADNAKGNLWVTDYVDCE